ncbi:MAG: ribokinase [Candidatus Sulfotelmatobacter sp.]
MSAGKRPVAVVGSINIDLVTNTQRIPVEGQTVFGTDFQIHAGGKGANQAVAVARLGYPVRMIGRLGDDAFGAQLRNQLEQAGVDVVAVATTPGSSGVATIIVAAHGENCIVINPGANALLTPDDLNANLPIIRSSGIVLTQLEIPLETVEHLTMICARERIPLILDPAPAKELPASLLQAVTWFTPNEIEAAFFTGESNGTPDVHHPARTAKALISRGIPGVVLKLGARGAFIASASLEEQLRPIPVHAVDTTAAGDAFNGAFAVGLLLGKDPVASARFATAAAALSVTRAGAQPSMPTMGEVDQLLSNATAGV